MDNPDLQWPFFAAHHQQLSTRLHEWCRAEINADELHHGDVRQACRHLVEKLAAGGWLRYVVEGRFGGMFERIDLRSVCLIRETLACYSGLADFAFAMQGLGSCAISLFGTPAQQQRILPAVVAGRKLAAFALTEESSGSDVANMELRADAVAGGYRLNGGKAFISNAGVADFYVTFARTGESPGARGITAFLIEAGTPGLDDSRDIVVNAPHPLGYLDFTNCDVGAEAVIGTPGAGFKHAMHVLDMFRCSVGAAALGLARRALHEATMRSLQRQLFGQLLSDNLITRSRLAEMAMDVDTSSLLIYRAAWSFDTHGAANTKYASMAKLHATESAQQVIDKAVQLFGGKGVTVGCVVESLYREVRSLRIYEGASEVQKLVIAKRHLEEYKNLDHA